MHIVSRPREFVSWFVRNGYLFKAFQAALSDFEPYTRTNRPSGSGGDCYSYSLTHSLTHSLTYSFACSPSLAFSSSIDTASTFWKNVTQAPLDPILGMNVLFKNDTDPRKVNVSIGAYRDDNGKPVVLKCVRKAEELILADKSLDKEYLPQRGNTTMANLAIKVLLGNDSKAIKENRVAVVQSLSGTGALRVCADFLHQFLESPTILYSNPTWGNHISIAKAANIKSQAYRYWDAKGRCLDLQGMLEDLRKAPKGSVVLLHACAHNPTGVDPTKEQWKQIAQVIRECGHLPWFDSAYQGFASGSLEEDAWAIRYFVEQGFEMAICQSFAKNFGLYGERVGTVSFISNDPAKVPMILSQLDVIIRTHYSNPPLHGARIVQKVLESPELTKLWYDEMIEMSSRIKKMRAMLKDTLVRLGTPGNWDHITSQIGMFSFTGLTPKQCELMINKHHIYLLKSGRISMAGVTTKNVEYIAKAIDDVVRNA